MSAVVDTSKWELRSDVHGSVVFWEVVEPHPHDKGPDDPNRSIVMQFGVRPHVDVEAQRVMACVKALEGCDDPEAFVDGLCRYAMAIVELFGGPENLKTLPEHLRPAGSAKMLAMYEQSLKIREAKGARDAKTTPNDENG